MTTPFPDAELALCAQTDPELFFPDETDRTTLAQAKQVCRQCPVKLECLAYALQNFSRASDWGVWGGTSASERRRLRSRTRSGTRTIHIGERKVNEKGSVTK